MTVPAKLVAPALAALFLSQASAQAPSQAPADELSARLARAVDLPTPAERRKAADELASDREVSLEAWLAAMRAFGAFEPAAAGMRIETVALEVAGRTEETELALRVPPGYAPGTPAPLLVSLHGTGGRGAGAIAEWAAVADSLGMLVLAPTEAGANEGYAYTDRERLSVLAALRWMRRHYDVDETRVYLTGVSRGGHLAWDLALRWPDRWAALAPLIGGPRLSGAAGENNLRLTENLWATPIRDLQGRGDDPGLLFDLRLAFERLDAAGNEDAVLIEQSGLGHGYRFMEVNWPVFLGRCRRDPDPSRVVHLCCRLDQGRSSWVEVTALDREVRESFRPKVKASEWNALSPDGQKRWLQREFDARTARIEVERIAAGRVRASTRHVRRFRLLLPQEHLAPDGKLEVEIDGRTRKLRARPSKRVLLREFVERFDRTFLPVAEVELR